MTADRVHPFLRAVAALDAAVTADVYWAGRAALCSGPDDTSRYDEVFAAWFSGDRSSRTLLGAQLQRLAGLAHRVVWLNPHRGGYLPVQAGIVAVLPYLDDLVAGHSLASFADLLEVVAHA